jgi:TatD DNase family protein
MALDKYVAEKTAKVEEIRYVDSHVHLADPSYNADLEQILKDARGIGVVAIIANSEDLDSSLATLEIAEQFPDLVHPAIGIHPWNASSITGEAVEQLMACMISNRERLIAIGEVGLDGVYAGSQGSAEVQIRVFQKMLEAASRLRLPVIVHSRKMAGAVLDYTASYDLSKVILHWYSGPVEFLRQIIQRGYYVTFGPSLIYAKHIQEIAGETPIDLILTETDGPVQYHGILQKVKTTPRLIPYVVEKLAEIKGTTIQEVAAHILRNSIAAFPKLPRSW